MAFGGSLYGSFTSNCLDGVPFKLGPKFQPPTKVVLPSDFNVSSQSSTLKEEYTFEVEEAVLKWSAEREKQLAEQRRIEQEIAESARYNAATNNDDEDNTDQAPGGDENIYENQQAGNEPLYENPGMLLPQPAPRPKVKPKSEEEYVNVLIPNPLIANISNDILKPMLSSSPSENSGFMGSDTKPASNNIDLTWFEKADDPFDNLELQTINDMEELASVLEETTKVSPEPSRFPEVNGDTGNNIDHSVDDDGDPNYENVELKLVGLKVGSKENIYGNVNMVNGVGSGLTNLPPVPPRRDLLERSPPLPPIGQSHIDASLPESVNQSTNQINGQSKNNDSADSDPGSFQTEERETKVISKRRVALPKPPRTFTYSRHDLNDSEKEKIEESNYENTQKTQPAVSINSAGTSMNVQFTKSHHQDLQSKQDDSDGLNFVNHHFDDNETSSSSNGRAAPKPVPRKRVPPPRPTSQPLNKYSPLPPTPRSSVDQPNSVSMATTTSPDIYSNLSPEAHTCVDNLAAMGFEKDRLARAVEKIGHDEKEVVEYLCLVDQLKEKGYNIDQVENALLLFHNSMKQASDYLEVFTQMKELGFQGDKIKEALVNTNNDREKALDILTATS